MEKQLLLEINRVNELMGVKRKPLIMEQSLMSVLKVFMSKGSKFPEALDDAATTLARGGKMTKSEADDMVKLIKSNKPLMDDIEATYKPSLYRSGDPDDLVNRKLEKFISDTKNQKLTDFVDKIKIITPKEIEFITSDVVKKMISEDAFEHAAERYKGWYDYVIDILKKNFEIEGVTLNLDDFTNFFNVRSYYESRAFQANYLEYLTNQLENKIITKQVYDDKIMNLNGTVGTPLMEYFENTYKYTNNPEITDLINQYRTTSRLDEGAGVIPKPVYGAEMPNIVENHGEGVSIFRQPSSKKLYNVSSWFAGLQTDNITNLFRSWFGLHSSERWLKETQSMSKRMIDEFIPGVEKFKLDATNIDKFGVYCRQLLQDMKISRATGQTWGELWEAIKADIRTQSNGNPDVESFIKEIESGGGYKVDGNKILLSRPEKTITYFLEQMEIIQMRPTLFGYKVDKTVRKIFGSSDASRDWTALKRYVDEAHNDWEAVKKASEAKGGGFKGGLNVVRVVIKKLWGWFSGWILYDAPRTYQRIVNKITYHGMTNGRLYKSLLIAWLGMVFMNNFIKPVLDGIGQYIEMSWLGDDPESPWDLAAREMGENIDDLKSGVVSAYMPFGDSSVIPIVYKYLHDAIMNIWSNQDAETKKAKENYNRELNDAIAKNLKEQSERNLKRWNGSDPETQERIKKKNSFYLISDSIEGYALPTLKLRDKEFVPLSYTEIRKIQAALVFLPELDPSTIEKITQSTIQDKRNKAASVVKDKLLNTIFQASDILGYTAIKTSDGKHYKLKLVDGFIWYITPSIEELKKDPSLERTDNRLQTILPKL